MDHAILHGKPFNNPLINDIYAWVVFRDCTQILALELTEDENTGEGCTRDGLMQLEIFISSTKYATQVNFPHKEETGSGL